MVDFLKALFGTFASLIAFVWNVISSLFNLISKLPTFVLFLTNSVALLPAILIPFIAAAISIYVVLFVIGRN